MSIEAAVKGLGVQKVLMVNPFKYGKTVEAVRELAQHRGVSVLIARAPCPLHDRILPSYRKMRPFQVNSATFRDHKDCVSKVACPAFFVVEGKVGSMWIDAPDVPSAYKFAPKMPYCRQPPGR